MQNPVVSYVDRDVIYGGAAAREQEQVARLEGLDPWRHCFTGRGLLPGGAWQFDPVSSVHVLDEPGAVKARDRTFPTITVVSPQVPLGRGQDTGCRGVYCRRSSAWGGRSRAGGIRRGSDAHPVSSQGSGD